MKRAALVLVLLAAGCGSAAPRPDHATLIGIDVGNKSVTFRFDAAPSSVRGAFAARTALAECGSGRPLRPSGRAFYVVHFSPAQTAGVPYRILTRPGPIREAAKICDFEADVAWAIALETRLPAALVRRDRNVILTFG